MDTRFWGPSGWRLLHSITFAYTPNTDRKAMQIFFEMLPFVLPCKYCRANLTEHMQKHPLAQALHSRETLTKWLWRIHNEVNAKLRSQKLSSEKDPPFEAVEKYYTDLLRTGCTRTEFPGWDFLFSIAECHPMSLVSKQSVPIQGAPPCDLLVNYDEKNLWNCLKPDERFPLYVLFWKSLGAVLPFPEWRASWLKNGGFDDGALGTRDQTLKWLWNLRCAMETELELLNRCKYSALCKTLKVFRSGCTKSSRAKTCRKKRSS
jgi:hypothetical protein